MKALFWLLRDGLAAFPREVALVVATGAAGNLTQLAALALLLVAARSLEHGSPLGLAPAPSIVVAGTAMLLSLAAAAGLLFVSRSRAVALTRRYEDLLAERIVERAGESPADETEPDRILPLLRSSSRRSARIAGKWLGAVQPVGQILCLVAFLLWLHVGFTLFLLAIVAAGGLAVRSAQRSVVAAVELANRHANGAANARRAVLRAHAAAPAGDRRSLFRSLLGPDAALEAEAYFGTLRSRARAALATDAWLAAAIPLVLVAGGLGAARGAWSWSAFVAHLVAAQALLASSAALARIVYSTSRVHHHVDDVFGFLAEGRLPDRSRARLRDEPEEE